MGTGEEGRRGEKMKGKGEQKEERGEESSIKTSHRGTVAAWLLAISD